MNRYIPREAVFKMVDRAGKPDIEYIALGVYKKYAWARVENGRGERLYESRLANAHGMIKNSFQEMSPLTFG